MISAAFAAAISLRLSATITGKGTALYASKAFCCKEICRIVTEEGLDLDVVSGGELYTALAAGVDAKHIHFHGNNKTMQELHYVS